MTEHILLRVDLAGLTKTRVLAY